jgi:hypothetical protein
MVNGANPEQFFLERSKKKNPSFPKKKIQSNDSVPNVEKQKGNAYRHTKSGYRPDIDMVVRSNWEANVIRILDRIQNRF